MDNEYKLALGKLIKYVNKINHIVSVMEANKFQMELDNIIVLILMQKIEHNDIIDDELINKYNIESNEDKEKLKNDFITDEDKIKYINVLNYFIRHKKFLKLGEIKNFFNALSENEESKNEIINYSNIITDSDDFLNALYLNDTIDINDLKDRFVLDNVSKIFKNLDYNDSIKLFLYIYIIQNINNDGLNLDSDDYKSIYIGSNYNTLDELIDLIDNIYKEIYKKKYTIDQFNNYIDQFNMNLNKYKIIEVENTHINNNVINYKCLYDGKLRKNNDIEKENYQLIKKAFKNNINKNNIDLYFQYIKKRYEYKTNRNIELIELEKVINDSDIYENNIENNIEDNEEMAKKKKKIKPDNREINDSNKNKINPEIQNDEEVFAPFIFSRQYNTDYGLLFSPKDVDTDYWNKFIYNGVGLVLDRNNMNYMEDKENYIIKDIDNYRFISIKLYFDKLIGVEESLIKDKDNRTIYGTIGIVVKKEYLNRYKFKLTKEYISNVYKKYIINDFFNKSIDARKETVQSLPFGFNQYSSNDILVNLDNDINIDNIPYDTQGTKTIYDLSDSNNKDILINYFTNKTNESVSFMSSCAKFDLEKNIKLFNDIGFESDYNGGKSKLKTVYKNEEGSNKEETKENKEEAESKVETNNNEIGNSQNIEDKIDSQLEILANKAPDKFNELVDEAGAEQWVKITDYSNFENIKEVSPTSYKNFISNISNNKNLLDKLNELVKKEPVEQKIDNSSKEQLTNEIKNQSIENSEMISKMETINNILENSYKKNKEFFYSTKNKVLSSIDEKESFTLKEKINELNDTLENIFDINNRAQSDDQVYLNTYNLVNFFNNPKELVKLEKKFKTDFENNEYDLNILENQLIYVYLLMDLIEANNKLDNESSKETTNNKSDINDDSSTSSNSSSTEVEELVNDKTENKESENKSEEEKSEEQAGEPSEQKDVKEEQLTTEKDDENKKEEIIDSSNKTIQNSSIDENSNLYKLIFFNNDIDNYWSTVFNEHYVGIKKKLLYLINVFSSSINHNNQKDDKLNELMRIINNKSVNYTNNKENYLDNFDSKITSFDTYFKNIKNEIKDNQNLKDITDNIPEDETTINISNLETMKNNVKINNEDVKNYFIKLIEFTISFQNCINKLNNIINQLYNFLK